MQTPLNLNPIMPPSAAGSFRSHSTKHRHNFRLSSPRSESPSPNHRRHIRRSASSLQPQMSVMINDIVGKGISGILYKWVNYGRGWRRRWFVLQDGVMSYYKLHGRDKITVNQDTERGSKVIGEASFRRVCSREIRHSQPRCKPFGEIHLKVSSIRESRTDDRRFSIFTGTKRLHLRAETREDRMLWMEALRAMKELFPRVSNNELMAPSENVVVSTEKLRQRLSEEGISESAIQDSEQIMKSEFTKMHSQLMVLKQRQVILVDALRHLEAEKVDLENTLVDESQRQSKAQEASSTARQHQDDGSASDSDVDNDGHDAAEEDTDDDDDDEFFDTQDFLSSSSLKCRGSDFRRLSFDTDDQEPLNSMDDIDSSTRSNGTNYPHVRRRNKLPDAVEKEKGVSLWSIIKDNIGKDLTKVCLPVYFNEPISSLQKCFEDLEYSYLLDQAYECGKMGNSLLRILNVAAFAVSGYACTDGRNCKPFNPLLGETYEADYPDMGLRFISEKVSHHPMIVACHCEGHGWKLWGDSNLKSKFWGRSIQLDPVGLLTLEFDDGEVFQYRKVTTSIYNLILGKLYCEHYGTMHIRGNRDYSCKIKFKEQSIVDRNPHQVQGIVQDRKGKTVATLFGKWDESMHYMNGDCSGKGKGSDPSSEAQLLWKRSKPSKFQTKYNFSSFSMTLNELTPGLEEKLPPTDSRLRPDQRCLENGQYEMANSEKLRLEQRQRQASKMQERGWKPRWFAKEKGENAYRYVGGYWETREAGKWESCPDIFGQVHKDHTLDS
ncbi:oxysterol-binding protein-related protein 1C isoform X2 [Vitis vinifera]|uniref:oxysterol-binding protein-related protein 1C isoform X2 n=1 Tax=Vitis vinifera TaxID=29760 RepID=UPI0008FFA57A|nr:oxysterol-binding protein-related protein 1C isoform X2 [Vitis vinifera]|eukprot:XP_019076421.1 PREDICTED: oxysterol-binding protein-related protein 1C isoform X2 [Vitis vinifera]